MGRVLAQMRQGGVRVGRARSERRVIRGPAEGVGGAMRVRVVVVVGWRIWRERGRVWRRGAGARWRDRSGVGRCGFIVAV